MVIVVATLEHLCDSGATLRSELSMMSAGRRSRTESEVFQWVREIERKYDLLTLTIDGISPWQLAKFEASVSAQGLNLARKPIPRNTLLASVWKGVTDFVRMPRNVRYLCKSFDSAYRVPDGALYRDIYFDDVLESLDGGAKISSCDAADFQEKRRRAAIPPIFDDTLVIVVSAVLAKVFPPRVRNTVFDEIARSLHQEGIELNAKRLAKIYNAFVWRAVLYRILLRRVKAEVVFCADGGQFALMHAARSLSIRFIELQHGVTTRAHPNVLPDDLSVRERASVLVPDAFAVYGQHVIDSLAGTLLGKEGRIFPVGAGFMDSARTSMATRSVAIKDTPFTITFTAQGLASEAAADFLFRVLCQIERDIRLQIKIHPAYNSDRDLYFNKFDGDGRVVIIDGNSDVSTNELIANSDLHVSISSSCHYDSLGLGVPTAILALETYDSVSDLLGMSGVSLLRQPLDVVSIIEGRSRQAVPQEVSEYFFQKNFSENVRSLVNRQSIEG